MKRILSLAVATLVTLSPLAGMQEPPLPQESIAAKENDVAKENVAENYHDILIKAGYQLVQNPIRAPYVASRMLFSVPEDLSVDTYQKTLFNNEYRAQKNRAATTDGYVIKATKIKTEVYYQNHGDEWPAIYDNTDKSLYGGQLSERLNAEIFAVTTLRVDEILYEGVKGTAPIEVGSCIYVRECFAYANEETEKKFYGLPIDSNPITDGSSLCFIQKSEQPIRIGTSQLGYTEVPDLWNCDSVSIDHNSGSNHSIHHIRNEILQRYLHKTTTPVEDPGVTE